MRNLSSIVKLGLVSAVMAIGFSGCGIKIPVKKEVGQLNLKFQIKEQKNKVNKKIAIIDPNFSRDRFNNSTNSMFSKSMTNAFEELILKKGFILGGKYKTFDDMTYPERKNTYMALMPILNIKVENKVTKEESFRLYSRTEGQYQLSGEFIVKMIEPLSKQMFITKRINLSDLNIIKPYIEEVQTRTSNADGLITGIFSVIMDNASAPKILIDTRDKAYKDAINEFYQKAMPKIAKYISQEEILSVENDINSAKGKTVSGL